MSQALIIPENNIIWRPFPHSSQERFLSCPIFECLIHGSRGGGKTDVLLMAYAQFIGFGFGASWRGIIFRENFKNLQDIIGKSKKWFTQIFPKAKYNAGQAFWEFREGERLYFRHARRRDDYYNYHGHEYPFIGWEELTNWTTLDLYLDMMSVCRSPHPDIPKLYRATTNPYGKGHNAVKKRFIDAGPAESIITEYYENPITHQTVPRERCHIKSSTSENLFLMQNDPDYIVNILQNADEHKTKAWAHGDWDIVAGGMFDDVFSKEIHILPRIERFPATWYFDRSFDYGSSHPFSVGWWAMSDGSPVDIVYNITYQGRTIETKEQKTFPKGTLIRFWEWYGCDPNKDNTGLRYTAQQIGEGIKAEERKISRIFNIPRIKPGPADSSIFDSDHNHDSIAYQINHGFGNPRRNHIFVPSNKAPGTRKKRWEIMRTLFHNASQFPMENKGFFVTEDCPDFIRTIPLLPRDEKDPDDVDTDAEDHIADECGYRCLHDPVITQRVDFKLG